MTRIWNWFWLTVALLSEFAALASLAFWGWTASGHALVRMALAVAAPLLAAVLWGVFAAPRARVQVAALAVAVKVLVLGAATLAQVATGHPWAAVVFGVLATLAPVLSTRPEGWVSAPAVG
ncbi:MAG: DUF2568 domain-containing protein [Blastococcus sp.]